MNYSISMQIIIPLFVQIYLMGSFKKHLDFTLFPLPLLLQRIQGIERNNLFNSLPFLPYQPSLQREKCPNYDICCTLEQIIRANEGDKDYSSETTLQTNTDLLFLHWGPSLKITSRSPQYYPPIKFKKHLFLISLYNLSYRQSTVPRTVEKTHTHTPSPLKELTV